MDKFRDVYNALYNSAESSEGVNIIKEKLKELIGAGAIEEVEKITGTVVKKAACKMKPGKSDVISTYTSDAILHSPDFFFAGLACIFYSSIVYGTISRPLLVCAFLRLLKVRPQGT